MKGVDYSWARPGGAAIKAAGFDFAMRYVPYPGDNGKGLEVEEIADLHGNGVGIGLVYESWAGRALDGYNAGVIDATQCLTSGRDLGWPQDRPFYFAVDTDIDSTNAYTVNRIISYFTGAAAVLGVSRVGAYAESRLLKILSDRKAATWFWQPLAWQKEGEVTYDFPGKHLYQYQNGVQVNGGDVDFNEAYGEDQGLWFPPVTVPPPNDPVAAHMDAVVKRFQLINLASDMSDIGYANMLNLWACAKSLGMLRE